MRVGSAIIDTSASIGLAYADEVSDPDALVRDADSALYAAKQAGKGR